MKYSVSVIIIFLIWTNSSFAKVDPDIERVSDLVNKKQDELKAKLISNLVLNFKEESNLLSFNTFDNIIRTLVNQKNKEVMKGEIISELARFVTTSTISKNFIANNYNKIFDNYKVLNDTEFKEVMAKSTKYKSDKDGDNLFDLVNDSTQIVNYIIDKISIKLFKVEKLKILYNEDAYSNYDTYNMNSYDRIDSYKNKIDTLIEDFFYNRDITLGLSLYSYFKDLPQKEYPLLLNNYKFMTYLLESLENYFSNFYKNNINFTFLNNISTLINKYILIDNGKSGDLKYDIDVEAIILELSTDYIDYSIMSIKNSYLGIELFFDIGVNNSLYHSGSLINSFEANTISYVSEKIGLKVIFYDLEYTRKQKINEWFKYRGDYFKWNEKPKQLVVSDLHLLVYYSGLLYNIIDLKSEESFNYSLFGLGVGSKFFNSLTISISYAIPISEKIHNSFGNGFINIGMDIPILEYLSN